MREILFRGQDTESGEWVYGYYVHFETMHKVVHAIYTGCADGYSGSLLAHCYDVKPETVGQYTGLTDKNKTRIFEGDILRLWGEGYDWNGIVVFGRTPSDEDDWEDYGYGWQLDKITKDEPVYTKILLWVEAEADGIDCEIIGNIYDNPELLKGDAENE